MGWAVRDGEHPRQNTTKAQLCSVSNTPESKTGKTLPPHKCVAPRDLALAIQNKTLPRRGIIHKVAGQVAIIESRRKPFSPRPTPTPGSHTLRSGVGRLRPSGSSARLSLAPIALLPVRHQQNSGARTAGDRPIIKGYARFINATEVLE